MGIDLYYEPGCSSCRFVRLVAANIDVDLNLILVNLKDQEQMKPEFLEMNPQHTVPTMDDNGFYLSEGRAICLYLIDEYAKDDSLYPKDPKQRAIVNHRLFFDTNTLYRSLGDYIYPQISAGAPADPSKLEKCHEAFGYLEKFLEGQDYVAGDHLTVADLILIMTVSNFTLIEEFDMSQYSNTNEWFERIESEATKYHEINDEGLEAFNQFLKQK